jgi:DNA-binding XRE family transcriptional regulator
MPDPSRTNRTPRPLRGLRAERLLTVRELARAAGVARSTVHLIEAGRTTPRQWVVRQLAVTLGVDPLAVTEFRLAIEKAGGQPA